MTNFIEEQQREVQTKAWAMFAGKNELTAHDVLDEMTNQTITNTLNHILESGLLEEKDVSGEFLCDLVYRMPPQDGDTVTHTHVDYSARKGHNTLARAIKAHLDELINSTK